VPSLDSGHGRDGRYSTEAGRASGRCGLGEADRVLHTSTPRRTAGSARWRRVCARRCRAFGRATRGPLSHVDLVLHRRARRAPDGDRGATRPVAPGGRARTTTASSVGMIGAEAIAAPVHRGGGERAGIHGADALPRSPRTARSRTAADRPTLDPLGLSFQLKLLWLAGYLPHVTACAECGAEREPLVGYSPRAGGGRLRALRAGDRSARASPPTGSPGSRRFLAHSARRRCWGLGLSEAGAARRPPGDHRPRTSNHGGLPAADAEARRPSRP